jgi:hypothetical protein
LVDTQVKPAYTGFGVNASLILFVKMAGPAIAVSRDFAAGVVISAGWQSSVA